MRITDEARDALGRPGRAQYTCPLLQATGSLCVGHHTFEALVEHPLYRSLRDAEITRAKALVKPADALFARNLLNRRKHDVPAQERTRFGRCRRCCCWYAVQAESWRRVLTAQIGFVAVPVMIPAMAAAQRCT
jgi:hypothetical protein